MSDIIRVCPKHGNLTINDIRIKDKRRIAKDGHRIISRMCKHCDNANAKAWRLKSGYKPPIRQGRHKRRMYGITEEQYQVMLKDRDYKCDTCAKKETKVLNGKLLTLCVDHCHLRNVIRGLLCWKCNTAFGLLYENIETLQRMIEYKKAHG